MENSIQFFLLLATLAGTLLIVALAMFKINDRYWDKHFQELEERYKQERKEREDNDDGNL